MPYEVMDSAIDPDPPFEHYYTGALCNAKLVARSSTAPWKAEWAGGTWSGPVGKNVGVVEPSHPLCQRLDEGLNDNILGVLATMRPCAWISVHYVRLGYDEAEENNPVVVLIAVEQNRVSSTEGQRIVDTVSEECRK